jgi:hypothetical protein
VSRRERDDTGAVAVLAAISLMAMLGIAALVLDIGLAHVDRTSNKASADAAVLAGVRDLSGEDLERKPWRGVCSALAYLRANSAQLGTLTGTYSNGLGITVADPCTTPGPLQQVTCSPGNLSTYARWDGTGASGVSVQIRSGYVLPTPPGDPFHAIDLAAGSDIGTISDAGCDHLAVIITRSRAPGLGVLASDDDPATDDNIVTNTRTVGRVTAGVEANQAVALLLLERTNCRVLDVSGGTGFIKVVGFGAAPGLIHADSLGNGSSCNNAKIFDSNNNPLVGISARKAETGGLPGQITTTALSGAPTAIPDSASDPWPSQVFAEGQTASSPPGGPTGRALTGRGLVDKRYLAPVQAAVARARSTINTLLTSTPAGWTRIGPGNVCNSISGTAATDTATKIYFDCPTAKFASGAQFPAATDLAFAGTFEVGSSNSFAAPVVQRMYVRGTTGTTGPAFDSKGNTRVRAGTTASPRTCTAQQTAMPTGRNELVVLQGPMSSTGTGTMSLCQTAVVMADNTGTPGCPLPLTATVPGPAPATNACRGTVNLAGGGAIDWSAPNVKSTPATTVDWLALEDLALWTESSLGSGIGGGGAMTVSGTFSTPNCDAFKIAGGGTQTNGANAQFVTRRLEVVGGGTLTMRPDPVDAITIPAAPVVGLVR